jgi:hypothetical protein
MQTYLGNNHFLIKSDFSRFYEGAALATLHRSRCAAGRDGGQRVESVAILRRRRYGRVELQRHKADVDLEKRMPRIRATRE